MNKKLIYIIVGLIVVVFILYLVPFHGHKQRADIHYQIVLYYGDACPHCKEVLAFLEQHQAKTKIAFGLEEVTHNKNNASELLQKVLLCNLSVNNVPLPFLWNHGQCIVGKEAVIQFFQVKLQHLNEVQNKT